MTEVAETFTLGDIRVGPGDAARGTLMRFTLAGSQELSIPLIVLNGKREGPTLLLIAACHGREVSDVGALLDALAQMDPTEMSGRVIAIPVGNPIPVQLGTYISPYDDVDVASLIAMPPNRGGTASQRIAAAIQDVIAISDYVIDLHAHPQLSVPLVLTARAMAPDEKAREEYMRFASAFGLPLVEQHRPCSRTYATQLGKPGINPELAGDHMMLEGNTSVGTRGILNCARVIGILPGEPEPQEIEGLPPLDGEYGLILLRINEGGFYKIHHDVGEFLREGERVATVFDHYGDVREEVKMPADGYLGSWLPGYLTQTWAVSEGDDIAYIIKPLAPGETPPGEAPGDHPGSDRA
ncbi:MAG TPA: succinylglutamate desuccinylase/aspartoacylase family protein [Gaiellaceae bacterium]|nr:succinylglutamate desuccinylase/aspartoacylase family protein [Gaiellaceae bacterium]